MFLVCIILNIDFEIFSIKKHAIKQKSVGRYTPTSVAILLLLFLSRLFVSVFGVVLVLVLVATIVDFVVSVVVNSD